MSHAYKITGFLLLLGCASSIQGQLRSAKQQRTVPEGLVIIYDDYHPRWGGMRVRLGGDRSMQVHRWRPGQSEGDGQTWRGRISTEALRSVIDLLVDIEAWDQRVAAGTPRIDDARARLQLQLGDDEASMWEWANDLEANDRLARVKRHLEAMAFDLRNPSLVGGVHP